MTVPMNDASIAVQTALFNALIADTALMSLLGGTSPNYSIYDMVPKNFPVPFVVIGDFTTVDNSTVGVSGQVLTGIIHTWDQNLSSKRLKQIMQRIIAALHDAESTLVSGDDTIAIVNCRFTNSQTMRIDDGLTIHGIQKFRIVAQSV